jgi:integrase
MASNPVEKQDFLRGKGSGLENSLSCIDPPIADEFKIGKFPDLTPFGSRVGTCHQYYFEIPGMSFQLLMGKRIPAELRRLCAHRTRTVAVTSILEARSLQEALKSRATAKLKGKLQFSIARESTDPRDETKALSATRARQLMGMPAGDTVLDYRDRAVLKFFLYSGARLSTACRLKVPDFHQEGDEATIRLHEKGDKRRTIGLHYQAAQAISEYIEKAGITSGPLFRPPGSTHGAGSSPTAL